MPEVKLHHGIGAAIDHPGVAQEIGDGAVAVAGRAFGREHGLIDAEIAPGETPERVADAVECAAAFGLVDQAGAGDGAGVDHRIEWMVVGVEPDRVEGLARGFDADRAFHPRRAQRIQRQRKHERLRHRLDGEGGPGVADFVDVAVDGDEADAELTGVGLAKLRNIVGHGAAGFSQKFGVAVAQESQ